MTLLVLAALQEHGGAEGGGGLTEAMGINFFIVGVQAVGFLLLLVFLYKLFWRRMFDHLKSREDSIRKAVDDAKKGREEVERLTAEYRQKIEQIEREASAKMQEAVRSAMAEKSRILSEAHEARMAEIEKAKAAIVTERDKAMLELRRAAVDLTMKATERVLGEAVTPDVQGRLVQKYLDELGRV